MLYEDKNDFVKCRSCGLSEFRAEERFRLKSIKSRDYDAAYGKINRSLCIVCVNCGEILDQSTITRSVGLSD